MHLPQAMPRNRSFQRFLQWHSICSICPIMTLPKHNSKLLVLQLILLTFFVIPYSSYAGKLKFHHALLGDGSILTFHQWVPKGDKPIHADIFFFPSMANKIEKSAALLDAWAQIGFRVVAFNQRHGEKIDELLDKVFQYEQLYRLNEGVKRPIILSGWSRGGLTTLRALERLTNMENPFGGREVLGAVSMTPYLGMKVFASERPMYHGGKTPKEFSLKGWNLVKTLFDLDKVGTISRTSKILHVPLLVYVAGDDRHVDSQITLDTMKWRTLAGAPIATLLCPGAYHEIQNETLPGVAEFVEVSSIRFLMTLAAREPYYSFFNELPTKSSEPCFQSLNRKYLAPTSKQ